jgi:hypothetical protein
LKNDKIEIACIEEIAYKMGFIDEEQLLKLQNNLKNPAMAIIYLKILEPGYLYNI